MDEPTTDNEHHDDVSSPSRSHSLHRSVNKKVFGGVAGGIAERFDVDANVIRVVFVVLALVWGLGVAVYLAMWALIPRSSEAAIEVDEPEEELSHVRAHWLTYALPLGVVIIGLIFLTSIHGGHRFDEGISVGGLRFDRGLVLFWLLFLIVLAVFSLRSTTRRLTFRRFFALVFLGFLSFLILSTGALLLTLQVIGVPVRGGSGVKVWRPTTTAQIQRTYHGAFGQSTIDLLSVRFSAGTVSIVATQGMGRLIVDVPDNAVINLRTHVGIGGVENNSYYVVTQSPSTTTTPAPHLNLNLQVGIGQIQIERPIPERAMN